MPHCILCPMQSSNCLSGTFFCFCQMQQTSQVVRALLSAGVANYTVAQGDTLNVNFNTNSSSVVIMGGSKSGGFAEDAPCQLTGHLGPATAQPVAANTITGFTFSPTRAVCPSVRPYSLQRPFTSCTQLPALSLFCKHCSSRNKMVQSYSAQNQMTST